MKPAVRFILILLFLLAPLAVSATELVLVVHKDNPVEQLELSEVRSIFLGKRTIWPNGRAMTIILQQDNDQHRQFALQVLGKSPRQLQMHWKRILFSGLGVPPRELPDDQTVIEMVARDPRAIGYISAYTQTDRVRTIRIDLE